MTTTSTPVSNAAIVAQPVVSVAGSTSASAAGGSVINVSSLVSELVAATRAPQDALIASETSQNTTEISAVGTLKSALSTFQSALTPLSTSSAFNAVAATSSDPTVFTASAAAGAVAGSYAVKVNTLASAEQLVSGPVAATGAATVGTGTLALSLGATSFNVTVNASNNTLAGIAAAINAASGNPGISATVVQGTDGAHLLLSSSLTGAANTITVSETDGGTALAALTYGTGNLSHYTQSAAAADASFSVAGVAYTSASNTVSNAISGVTLTLLGTSAAGTSQTLSLANDTTGTVSNIQSLVSAYNTLAGQLTSLGSYDSTTGTAGPMLGDALLEGIQNQIKQALYSTVGSAGYTSLASIGITTQSNGTLSVNTATLQNALASNFGAVSQLFSGTNGIAAQLNSEITQDLASGGLIDSRSQTLIKQSNALTAQTNTLNTQMSALTASLTQQYSALNVLLSSLQTTSSQLSQSLASLPDSPTAPRAIG